MNLSILALVSLYLDVGTVNVTINKLSSSVLAKTTDAHPPTHTPTPTLTHPHTHSVMML